MNAHEHDPRPIDELAARRGVKLNADQLTIDGVPAQEWIAGNATALDALHEATNAIPGRDGWRLDDAGIEWYSDAWLGRP